MSWTVGQKVLITTQTHRSAVPVEDGVVRKVGRSYVYASRDLPGWEHSAHWRKFDAVTGIEGIQIGAGGHIYTPEQWADKRAHESAIEELRALGVARNSISITRFASATNAQLRAMIQILLPEKLTGDVEQVRSQLAFLPIGSQVRCHWPNGQQEDHYAVRVRANGAGSENWSLLNETGWLNMATWGCEIWVEHRAHWSSNLVSENELTQSTSVS